MALRTSERLKVVETGAVTTLADLRPGQTAEVVEIVTDDESRLMKLAALGIVPGCTVHLQQRRPAYVVRAGETLLSLAREVAAVIHVRPALG